MPSEVTSPQTHGRAAAGQAKGQGRRPTLAGIGGDQAQLPRQLLLLCLAVLLLFLPFAAGRRCTAQPHHATLFLIFSVI